MLAMRLGTFFSVAFSPCFLCARVTTANIHAYTDTYMDAITIDYKRGLIFEGEKVGYLGQTRSRKERVEVLDLKK